MKNSNTLLTVAAGIAMAACSSGPSYDYYRIQSKFIASAQGQQAPEIIPTPAYSQLAGGATTVALRAPDQCSNNTANQATGAAAANGTILQTNCGVEMGEIERALTRAGYNVISWNIIDREMARTNSAQQAASSLGAQVLFQINSLERSTKTLGTDARWERSYFVSDYAGKTNKPMPLSDQTRAMLSERYLAKIEADAVPRTPAVTLDAVAIWVPTGQSMWYYRWTRAADVSDINTGYTLRLECMQPYGFDSCTPHRLNSPTGPATVRLAAGESVALSAGERPEDVQRAQYLVLFKEVVRNLVDSFARARQFAPPAAVAPAAVAPAAATPTPTATN